MTIFLRLWNWLNTSHCFCGHTDREICRKHEFGRKDATCVFCRHLECCHLINNGANP